MIVVTGATGNVGTHLVETLSRADHSVTAVARTVSPRPGCRADYRAADLDRPGTLEPILKGADALFLICAGEHPDTVVELAVAAGVSHVVLLSSQGAGTRPDTYPHPRAFEDAVQGSPVPWTILRPGGFATNTLRWAPTIRADRTAIAPFGDVALPIVDPTDIAEVAAAVLTEPGHDKRIYELTGPAAVSPREQVRAIGEALETPVQFVEQTRDEAAAQMRQFMPDVVVEATLNILGEPRPEEQRVSSDVPQLIGRPARSYGEWVRADVDAFR